MNMLLYFVSMMLLNRAILTKYSTVLILQNVDEIHRIQHYEYRSRAHGIYIVGEIANASNTNSINTNS